MDMMPETTTMDHPVSANGGVGASAPLAKATKNAGKTIGEKIAAEMKIFNDLSTNLKSQLTCDGEFEEKCARVVRTAAELFGVAPTWTAFYREVLGEKGIVRTIFVQPEERESYEGTEQHSQIFEMLTTLRSRDLPENDPTELQRMITIRLPMSLHNAICDEANELEVSVNKLCISRMLQPLDGRMIPACKNKRRGRRPGAAPIGKSSPVKALDEQPVG